MALLLLKDLQGSVSLEGKQNFFELEECKSEHEHDCLERGAWNKSQVSPEPNDTVLVTCHLMGTVESVEREVRRERRATPPLLPH